MIAILLLSSHSAFSQRHSVENVTFTVQENNVAIILYDIEARGRDNRYNVNLILKNRSVPGFEYQPRAVLGDIGKGRFEGKENKIVWSIDHEPPENFEPNPFINNYYFTIEARRRSRTGWWLLTALIGGAAYYYLAEY